MLAFFYGTRELLWTGIARTIFAETGAIRDTLQRCEQLVRNRLGWSLAEACSKGQSDSPQLRGPVLIAIQIALTEGWRERRVEPDVIAARSGGEFAAEYARGVLSLEDAMEIACRISHLVSQGRGKGSLLLVSLGFAEAERLARSSPVRFFTVSDVVEDSTIIACETAALGNLKQLLEARRITYRVVDWGKAPHCPLIDDWKLDLLKPLSGKSSDRPPLPYYSAAATGRDDGTTSYSTRLWRAVREPCLTIRMLDNLIADGCKIFLEIGSWPLLAPSFSAERQPSTRGSSPYRCGKSSRSPRSRRSPGDRSLRCRCGKWSRCRKSWPGRRTTCGNWDFLLGRAGQRSRFRRVISLIIVRDTVSRMAEDKSAKEKPSEPAGWSDSHQQKAARFPERRFFQDAPVRDRRATWAFPGTWLSR